MEFFDLQLVLCQCTVQGRSRNLIMKLPQQTNLLLLIYRFMEFFDIVAFWLQLVLCQCTVQGRPRNLIMKLPQQTNLLLLIYRFIKNFDIVAVWLQLVLCQCTVQGRSEPNYEIAVVYKLFSVTLQTYEIFRHCCSLSPGT